MVIEPNHDKCITIVHAWFTDDQKNMVLRRNNPIQNCRIGIVGFLETRIQGHTGREGNESQYLLRNSMQVAGKHVYNSTG